MQRNISVSGHIFAIESTRQTRVVQTRDGNEQHKILRPRVNFQVKLSFIDRIYGILMVPDNFSF